MDRRVEVEANSLSWFLTGLLYMYRYGIMRQSSKSLGTHGVCAKQFCTS
eukprot:COSAG05_NODE_24642_length_237_cov_2.746377_1_plen_48_part_10